MEHTMSEHELRTVIARREFECGSEKVILEIGTPYPVDEGRNWFCPWRISGLGFDKVRRTGGVDSMQALYLAMQSAAADLYSCDVARQQSLRWLDQRNLGLPFLSAIADLVPPEDE